jgi:hypothetical protein
MEVNEKNAWDPDFESNLTGIWKAQKIRKTITSKAAFQPGKNLKGFTILINLNQLTNLTRSSRRPRRRGRRLEHKLVR